MFGTPLCLIGGHLISSQLYKTKGNDPVVLMSATPLLMAGARIAGFMPARRAASIDPMRALRPNSGARDEQPRPQLGISGLSQPTLERSKPQGSTHG